MARYIKLKNGNAELTVDRVGAQIVSYKVDGVEIMYQGALNPENSMWKATAKNLFPNPGPIGTENEKWGELKTETYNVNGKEEKHTIYVHNGGLYHMGQHGFAQSEEFDVHAKRKNYCVLSISSDRQQTYTQYPYKFTYYVVLELGEDGNLNYMTCAQNDDTKPMLAGMGWHPAFKLYGDSKKYKLFFENLEKEDSCEVQEGVGYDIYSDVISKSKSKAFSGIKSADIVLCYERNPGEFLPYLKMHTSEPNLILWSKNRENESQEEFICIEPWNTMPRQISKLTTQDKTRELSESGAVIIEPSEKSYLKAGVNIYPEYILELQKTLNPDNGEKDL